MISIPKIGCCAPAILFGWRRTITDRFQRFSWKVPGPAARAMEVAALRTLPSPLGAWVYCGFNPDILIGAIPEIARGLGFHVEAPNPKAPE